MGDLSKRLSRHEFACRCGCGLEAVDYKLVVDLEDCCEHFEQTIPDASRVIIHINSGNRCAAHDRAEKIKIAKKAGIPFKPKTKKSEHLNCWAADFWLEYENAAGARHKIHDDKIADYLAQKHVARGGIGRYIGRTHYDVRTNGPARWDNR